MPICPHCHEFLPYSHLASDPCPNCGAAAEEAQTWRDAARVSNLAEAGYLVSRLAGDGIDARLMESESFSALAGMWSSAYLLQVPAESLAEAKTILNEEAQQADLEEPPLDARGEPLVDEPVHLVFWRPVALMAVAGLATLWLGQRVADPRPRVGPHRGAEALGAALEAVGEPFVVENAAGQTRHRLRYQSQERTWYLESDTNSDGRLDHRQKFILRPAARN